MDNLCFQHKAAVRNNWHVWRSRVSWVACLLIWFVISDGRAFGQASAVNPAPDALRQLSLDDLMNIEVTSVSREPEPFWQAPASIDVITQDQIRRSGAESIPEALRLADNLDIAQENSHDWAISARGFNSALGNKLLVMIDGRTVYSPLFSGVFWNAQDYLLEDLNRIEVISGPGGTLWGATAVNGVINITTKDAKDTQGFYVEGGGGSQPEGFGGIRYGGTFAPNVYFRVYGKYTDWDNEAFPNGNSAHDAWGMGQGGFRIDAEPTGEHLTLQGDLYDSKLDVATTNNQGIQSGGNLLARWTHTISDDSDMTLQTYYDRTHLTDPQSALFLGPVQLAPAGFLRDDLDTFDIDFQHRFSDGEHNHFVWGLGYRFTHDVVQNAPGLGFTPPVLDQSLISGFIQDEIMLVKNLNLTLGTKIEHNDYTGFELEPSARLQWNFAGSQTVWGAVSRAVRTPSRIDRDIQEPSPEFGPVLAQGRSTFTSETLIAYELGYRAQFDKKADASISAFYNDYNNLRSSSFSPNDIMPFFFANNLYGHTYGIEVSSNYQVCDWWRLHAGYDLLEEHIRVKPGQMDLNNGLDETCDPKHQFSIRSSMDLFKNVELDAGLRWVDTLHNNNGPVVGTVPSYFELDIRLSWHPTERLEFSVVGQNLLHSQHPEYGFPSPTREEIVRSVYGKVAWHF